jgi:hypothetical protein
VASVANLGTSVRYKKANCTGGFFFSRLSVENRLQNSQSVFRERGLRQTED